MIDKKGNDIYGEAAGLLDRLGSGRSVIDTQPEVEELTIEEPPKQSKRQHSKPEPKQEAKMEEETLDPVLKARITVYLEHDLLARLDEQGIAIRKELGRKRDRSELIGEAIEQWLERVS